MDKYTAEQVLVALCGGAKPKHGDTLIFDAKTGFRWSNNFPVGVSAGNGPVIKSTVTVVQSGPGSSPGSPSLQWADIGGKPSTFPASPFLSALCITVDGQGMVPTPGSLGFITVPYKGTIKAWYITANASGSILLDIKRDGVSIIGAGNAPELSAAQRADEMLDGTWTSNVVQKWDELEVVLDSAAYGVTRATIVVAIMRDA